MGVSIINNLNNVVLNYFDVVHVFQKEDLTLQKFDTFIVFQDSRQKQKVNYSDITSPASSNINDLITQLIGYLESDNPIDLLQAIKQQTEVNQQIVEHLIIQTELLKELNT